MIKILVLTTMLQASVSAFEYSGTSGSFSMSQYPACEAINGLENPALFSRAASPFFLVSGEQPWGMSDLIFIGVKAVLPFKSMAVGSTWSYFGSEEYRENIVDSAFSISPLKWLSFAGSFTYYNLYIHDSSVTTEHFFDGGFYATVRPFNWLYAGAAVKNIGACLNEKHRVLNGNYYFSLGLIPVKGVRLLWNCQKTPYGFNNSLMVSVSLLPSFQIKGGYNLEGKTFSGAVDLVWKYIHVNYTINHHTYLGTTHSFSMSYSLKKRSMESVEWSEKPVVKKKRIDINSCSLGELLSIPVLNETIARRIMLYRKKIGPVTEKALFQIGLESREIKSLMHYIYGLKKTVKKRKKWKKYKGKYRKNNNRKFFTHKDKKRLFHALVKTGVPSMKAVKLSHARYKRNYQELNRLLNGIADHKLRQRARALCVR